ncbi:putative spermidine/putrescine transport system permease protein [Bosea sp. OK403]|nr:putative spermidine/putrescine transport system permease protein [Bosea sp. OK403]
MGYVFLILPTLIVVPLSFNAGTELSFPPTSFSLAQYRTYFFESNWWEATVLSFWVGIATMMLSLVLGVPAAYALVRADFPGKKILTLFLLSPILVPVIVVALGVYLYFASIGIKGVALPIVLGHTLIAMPFVVITAMAGMQNVDRNLEVASQIMGAGRLLIFYKVTLPLLRPAIVAGALFSFLISFDEVVIAYFVGRAGFSTLPVKMFGSIQWEISPVIAAISTLLTLLSLGVCLLVAATAKDE